VECFATAAARAKTGVHVVKKSPKIHFIRHRCKIWTIV